jgi:hypothetical protein
MGLLKLGACVGLTTLIIPNVFRPIVETQVLCWLCRRWFRVASRTGHLVCPCRTCEIPNRVNVGRSRVAAGCIPPIPVPRDAPPKRVYNNSIDPTAY